MRLFIRTIVVAATAASAGLAASAATEADIVIYGSTPAAISAAIQARRMGAKAVVVSPETRIGGLTTGGLGQTDSLRRAARAESLRFAMRASAEGSSGR